jgi:uncharacterized protein with FMN-binding domain
MRRLLVVVAAMSLLSFAFGAPAEPVKRTRAEVDALVQKAGETKPEWWDSVQMDYPKTLDLTRTQKVTSWDPQHSLSIYIMGAVNPDPAKWNPAIKLLHYVLETYKDDPKNVQQTQSELAHVYGDLLGDYARGAYWLKQRKPEYEYQEAALARYYLKLGDPTMTREIASKYDTDSTRNAMVVRMWSSIGELDKALEFAKEKAEVWGEPDSAYLAAGDACRHEGKYDEAAKYYEKAGAATEGSRDLKRNVSRAKASLEAVKAAAALDLAKVPDGTYTGSAPGFRADVKVEVVVKGGRIDSVRVVQHKDDWFCSSLTEIPAQIVEKRGLKGVDAVTGATITSEGIMNAAIKALFGAGK